MQLLTALAVFAAGAEACIRVHAVARYQPLWGDGVSIKVYDNDDFYCEAHVSQKGANSETHWITDCPNGDYHVELWSNGKAGRITHKVSDDDTWSADLTVQNTDTEEECEIETEGGCKLRNMIYTSCLWDNFGNCGSYNCGL
ncbi:hypothetical protein G7054_g3837 [Neopestalotiopsis clavispora]|nr:hypothetical protein G7054_g3837 [Neopestalotiopsis clavispora]